MPAFKSNESFLEKISMGATGTLKVLADLSAAGHQPIELERSSTSFKIWKSIKIKRIRVPDILCLACARRVESRAKISFEISMSHSLADPDRAWDVGLNETDLVAIVVCERSGPRPIDWQAQDPVQYLLVTDLRAAYRNGHVLSVKPKGAGEGFELRVIWPSAPARSEGTITAITDRRIQYRRDPDSRVISLALSKQGVPLTPLLRVGERVLPHQAIAAVVPVKQSFACERRITNTEYIRLLSATSLTNRYAAAKALSHVTSSESIAALKKKLGDDDEHIYVRLECAAGLARMGEQTGWSFVEQCLADEYPQHRLEATIVLAEIPGERSSTLLSTIVRERSQHPEIRAGAAWALGEINSRDGLDTLIECFSEEEHLLRVEAARALAKLSTRFSTDLLGAFPRVTPDRRPGIAWALSKAGTFEIHDLIEMLVDDDARQWIAYMVGTQKQARVLAEIEELRLRDPQVYFAVTVLWKIMTSWIDQLETYG